KASLNPAELKAMVDGIRQVQMAMGDGRKVPAPSEVKNIAIARRSIVARRAIAAGTTFAAADLTAKRPGGGISPLRFWEVVGQTARRDYEP
ncbi:SAF domain-containing protein, partial [Acinetobacter baumannii]